MYSLFYMCKMQFRAFVFIVLLFPIISSGQKDIVFILDRSSEVSAFDFREGVNFIQSVVSYLDIGLASNLVSVLTYSENVTEVFDLKTHQDKAALLAAIKNIGHIRDIGNRDTHKSLAYAHSFSFLPSHGGRDHVGRAVVLITHGVSYVPFAIRESSSLKNMGAELFTIGIGSAAVDGLEEMQAVSSDPDSKYVYTLLSFSELKKISKDLADKLKEVTIVSTPAPIKHVDVSIIIMVVVASLFGIVMAAVIIYACLYQRHRREIMRIAKEKKCGTCNPPAKSQRPSQIASTSRQKETDNSSLPNSLTSSTDDTGYMGSDQANDVILGTRMVSPRKPSRPKMRRSRAVRPSQPVVSPRAVEFQELHDVVQERKATVGQYDYPRRTAIVDRQEKFIVSKKSQIKSRRSSSGQANNKAGHRIEVPWCDSFAYPPQGVPVKIPASGRGAVFQVIPPP